MIYTFLNATQMLFLTTIIIIIIIIIITVMLILIILIITITFFSYKTSKLPAKYNSLMYLFYDL